MCKAITSIKIVCHELHQLEQYAMSIFMMF